MLYVRSLHVSRYINFSHPEPARCLILYRGWLATEGVMHPAISGRGVVFRKLFYINFAIHGAVSHHLLNESMCTNEIKSIYIRLESSMRALVFSLLFSLSFLLVTSTSSHIFVRGNDEVPLIKRFFSNFLLCFKLAIFKLAI